MDINALETLAAACGQGLQGLSSTADSMFSDFPHASCGPATEIVGRIIKERTGLDGGYDCGSVHPELKPSQSHAWCEVGEFIIDITYDQFQG